MSMTGTIVNALAIVAGGAVGLLFQRGIPERVSKTVMIGLGLCVLYIGISGAFACQSILIVIVARTLGAAAGALLNIDGAIHRLGTWVEAHVHRHEGGPSLAEGFVTASLLCCVGAMAVNGSLDAGIRGDNSILQKEGVVDYNYAPADDLPDAVDFDGDASWMGSVAAAAAIGTGTAIVAYQFGTTVYLDSVLPEGADIPVTYGQLAKLMWQNAGSPEPETALAPDADEVQKAMAWAAENELIDAHRKADFLVSRVSVIRAWNKAQKLAAAK